MTSQTARIRASVVFVHLLLGAACSADRSHQTGEGTKAKTEPATSPAKGSPDGLPEQAFGLFDGSEKNESDGHVVESQLKAEIERSRIRLTASISADGKEFGVRACTADRPAMVMEITEGIGNFHSGEVHGTCRVTVGGNTAEKPWVLTALDWSTVVGSGSPGQWTFTETNPDGAGQILHKVGAMPSGGIEPGASAPSSRSAQSSGTSQPSFAGKLPGTYRVDQSGDMVLISATGSGKISGPTVNQAFAWRETTPGFVSVTVQDQLTGRTAECGSIRLDDSDNSIQFSCGRVSFHASRTSR